jgi:hypothetical protein
MRQATRLQQRLAKMTLLFRKGNAMRPVLFWIGLTLAGTTLAQAQTLDSPQAVIQALYAPYLKAQDQAPDAPQIDTGGNEHAPFFSDRLSGLIKADEIEADGEVGKIDFDPVVVGQDWTLSKPAISRIKITGQTATATVSFTNLGESIVLRYSFVHEHGNWQVDDIACVKGSSAPWVLSAILTGEQD